MALNTVVQGNAVTQVRDDIYLVDVIGRAAEKERGSIDTLLDLQLQSSSGQSVPLSSVATFHYELEQPTIWRRDRIPTITIKAGIGDATQPATVVKALSDKVSAFEKTLPAGYSVKIGGAVEESAKSQGPIAKVAPAMFVIMATLLMIQLQSFHRLFWSSRWLRWRSSASSWRCSPATRRSGSSHCWACSRWSESSSATP